MLTHDSYPDLQCNVHMTPKDCLKMSSPYDPSKDACAWTPQNFQPCDEAPPDPNSTYTVRGLLGILLVMMLVEVREACACKR